MTWLDGINPDVPIKDIGKNLLKVTVNVISFLLLGWLKKILKKVIEKND